MARSITDDQLARLEKFLDGPWIAVLATIGSGGAPLLTPVWYNYSDGRITITSRKETIKFGNATRDSRVALTICSEPQAEEYVTVWGRADTMDGDSIWPPTRAIIARYTEPDGVDAYLAQLQKQNRAIISVQPERVRFRT